MVSKLASVTSGAITSTVASAEAFFSFFRLSLPSRQSRTLAVDRPERLSDFLVDAAVQVPVKCDPSGWNEGTPELGRVGPASHSARVSFA